MAADGSAPAVARVAEGGDPFRAFNQCLKRFIGHFRDVLPPQQRGFTTAARATYKVLKSVNRKLPRHVFRQSLEEPHGARLRAMDEAYFFSGVAYSDLPPVIRGLVADFTKAWMSLEPEARRRSWRFVHELMDLSQACQKKKGGAHAQLKTPEEADEDEALAASEVLAKETVTAGA